METERKEPGQVAGPGNREGRIVWAGKEMQPGPKDQQGGYSEDPDLL